MATVRHALFLMFAMAAFAPQTIEMNAWVGERFVLLPKPPKSQQFGYRSFVPALPYAEWRGKTLTVTSVEEGNPTIVTFKAAGGATLRAEAYVGTIHDLALVRDFEGSRKQWLGKTLRLRVNEILTYDLASDRFGSIALGKGARVVVKDIVPGVFDYEPVRFVLKSGDGREGFLDVQVSGTNVSKGMRGTDTFDQLFDAAEP